jgi:hypothetical protein
VTKTDRRPDLAATLISRRWVKPLLFVLAYAVAGGVAHLISARYLEDLTLLSYALAEMGGAAFLIRYVRTDWRTHPWGRHVMAFMVCMEILFTLALSRRIFGYWPGLVEALFLSSASFAAIIWWRYHLLAQGGRTGSVTHDNARSTD